jgi:hypothetical protein
MPMWVDDSDETIDSRMSSIPRSRHNRGLTTSALAIASGHA